MTEFFNQTICILLVIAITIIFLKVIYSNGIVSAIAKKLTWKIK